MNSKILDLNNQTKYIFKECFDNNESPKNIEIIDWQFFKNKNKNFVDIEFDEINKKAAAIYATFGIKFKINNEIYLGSQSLDTITDVNYRGKGLFIKLAKDVYKNAKSDNVALVYGFPNGNSIHGFKNKLDWKVLDPVPFLIKPLRSSYFTKKIPFLKFLPNINISFSKYKRNKKYTIEESPSFPEAVNELWQFFSKDIKVTVHRDKEYLHWRYVEKPFEDYKILHCYDQNKVYLGYIIYSIKEKHGGKVAYIMELIYNLNIPESGQELLKCAISKIKKSQADCILSWCFQHSPNFGIFKRALFLNMPEKFRPIELHFGANSFIDGLKTTIYDRKNWYISYSDSDTV